MQIDFKKDEKGNETATISKADFEQAIAEAKQEASKEAKGSAVKGIEDKYNISFEEIKNMKKTLKSIQQEKAKEAVKQVYLENGGKAEYFDDFYASNKFDNAQDLKEEMKKVKEVKKIFFNKPQAVNSVHFAQEMGIDTDASVEEILNDGQGKTLTQRLREQGK